MTGEVSPVGEQAQGAAPVELRASHADRDRVVEVLRVAAGDGRLTPEELDQRLEVALTARTLGELAVLTTDLPAESAHSASMLTAKPKDLVKIECGSGRADRDGQWVVPQRMEIKVTSGAVKLDFTNAVIAVSTLSIDADVRSGRLLLITRPGIVVDADDVSVSSGRVKVRPQPGPPQPERLRIEISGRVSSGEISARPPRATTPRRSFWQWLLRRPKRPAIMS